MLELIISISVIGIFSAMIFGDFKNNEIRELKNISQSLIEDIKYIQKISIAKNSFCSIILDSSGKYTLMKEEGINESKKIEDITYLPEGYSISFDKNFIEFTPTGTLARGSSTISIYGKNNHYCVITITPSTGFAKIKEVN